MGRDFLLRQLTAGDTEDYIGRGVTATVDYLGRELVLVWAISTVTAVGDHVELSADGPVLRATVAGTTDATTEPLPPGYGNTVVDGTVTWEQVTATP